MTSVDYCCYKTIDVRRDHLADSTQPLRFPILPRRAQRHDIYLSISPNGPPVYAPRLAATVTDGESDESGYQTAVPSDQGDPFC